MLIIGVGNAFRGDDSVGLEVARQLGEHLPHATICEASGEGASLMELWKDAAHVMLIDAVSSGGEPGTIYRLEAHREPVPAAFFHYSTHDFGVAEAIEMARVLHQLPPRLVVYGIEGAVYSFGAECTPAVAAAIPEVVRRMVAEVRPPPDA